LECLRRIGPPSILPTDARVVARGALPSFCPAPTVLINLALSKNPGDILTGIYIGFDGRA
jgi:hypothetical protein